MSRVSMMILMSVISLITTKSAMSVVTAAIMHPDLGDAHDVIESVFQTGSDAEGGSIDVHFFSKMLNIFPQVRTRI